MVIDSSKIQTLIEKWKKENDILKEKVDILMNAKKFLPERHIDSQIEVFLAENMRLLRCVFDIQELLLFSSKEEKNT